MPSSSKEGKDIIRSWISEFSSEIKTVLDLGTGNGTYSRLFKRKSKLLEHAKWIGVEAWEPYIEEFSLKQQYDLLINDDIRNVNYKSLGKIDITFIGDVLEHISKDQAIELINRLKPVSTKIIISIPIIHWEQGEVGGNPFERHVKDDWSNEEMLETFPEIKRYHAGNKIGVYLIE